MEKTWWQGIASTFVKLEDMKAVADKDGLRPVIEACEHHIPGDLEPASNVDMDPMLGSFLACIEGVSTADLATMNGRRQPFSIDMEVK